MNLIKELQKIRQAYDFKVEKEDIRIHFLKEQLEFGNIEVKDILDVLDIFIFYNYLHW